MTFPTIAATVARSGLLAPQDVLDLRRAIFADGLVSREECAWLFAIERDRRRHSDDWSDLFVEAVTQYALYREAPDGYLSTETADWLVAEISRNAHPSTDGEVELVINLIEKAREVPASFAAFALNLVKTTVLYEDGPDRRGEQHVSGRVSAADITSLRRILWGAGPEGLLAVRAEEADALFAIASATTGADNDPEFNRLFAQCIANYLIGATARQPVDRETARRWQLDPGQTQGVFTVLAGALAGTLDVARGRQSIVDTLRNNRSLGEEVERAFRSENERRAAATAVASVVTAEKAAWLMDRLGGNGVISAPERALLEFLAEEASTIDPSIAPLMSRA